MSSTSNVDAALRGYTDRVVRLHEERETLNKDIREVYAEAKDAGFDTTVLREIVRELRMEPDARNSRYETLDTYRQALGMLADLPLGEAAVERRAAMPAKTFAEQPVGRRRGRPRRSASDAVDDAIGRARSHLGEPAHAADG